MSAQMIDACVVDDSIGTHCTPGVSDMGAIMDRLARAGRYGCSAEVSAAILTVTGQIMTETDVVDRCVAVEKYKMRLQNMLGERGIAQRTPAWYSARDVMITASDFAQALGFSKFGNRKDFYEKKCGFASPKPFDDNVPPLRWGFMFEPVACKIYSRLNVDVAVHEFGLLRHPTVPFLDASPDGVTEDGVMLEIKCPWRRKIDGTVPQQYYFQIQGQLSVCGLSECDYFEVEFDELRRAGEVEAEFCDETFASHEEAVLRSITRGVFVEVKTLKGGEQTSKRYMYPEKCCSHEFGTQFDHLNAFVERTTHGIVGSSEESDGVTNINNVVWWRVRRHNTIKVPETYRY
eukprot:gene29451-biopygen5374